MTECLHLHLNLVEADPGRTDWRFQARCVDCGMVIATDREAIEEAKQRREAKRCAVGGCRRRGRRWIEQYIDGNQRGQTLRLDTLYVCDPHADLLRSWAPLRVRLAVSNPDATDKGTALLVPEIMMRDDPEDVPQ
jgi:hypothetical protein